MDDYEMQGLKLVEDKASSDCHLIFILKAEKNFDSKKYFWSDEEHFKFLELEGTFAKDYKAIAE